MPINDPEKLNRIEDLKSKLFSRNYKTKIEHRDGFTHLPHHDVPDSWKKKEVVAPDAEDKFVMKTPILKKFFIFSVIFFALAVGYASYMFFVGGNTVSNANIDISVVGNSFTAGGEDLSLVVGITNRNNSDLQLVDLVVEYPKGGEGDLSADTQRKRQSLGTIAPGEVRNENVKVVLFGEQGSIRPVKIAIEYRVDGSNAIFVKEKIYEVTINSTPVNLTMDAPAEASPNQDFNFNVKVGLNATKAVENVLLRVDYPSGYQFLSANPKPAYGNNIWNMGDLPAGSERTIQVTGKMLDVVDGEEKTFRVSSGLQAPGDKTSISVVFNTLAQVVQIKKPFIEARLYINGAYQQNYSSDSKTPIYGEIHWTNNLDTKINDLSIVAKLSGNALNRKSILARQGFYNSLNDTITWDKNSQDKFKEINPGDSGTVNFSLSPLSLFSASVGILSSPVINIDISIAGKQSVEGFATKELKGGESKTIKIISDVGFAAKALYYSGAFTNKGSIPPKVGAETTYTIVWSLTNSANSISKAVVHSTLPPWVSFVGPFSPTKESLVWNAATREVTWNVGSIPKGTGISADEREVSFQVSFTPSLSQVGTGPNLVGEAVLTGHDDFANVDVTVRKTSLSTMLLNDPQFPPGGERVVE